MQNNITELTQKLLRALDSNYNTLEDYTNTNGLLLHRLRCSKNYGLCMLQGDNELHSSCWRHYDNYANLPSVTNMATVIEVITLLEKVSITKELLETTRLGKHINELRRNIPNESLAKRAKELLKKWRRNVMAVPASDTNGQIKQSDGESKKRPTKDKPDINNAVKRPRVNGVSEYEFSDNSNSSFKDALVPKNVILINSDSNSSLPDVKHEPVLEEQQPKKRGRKKGSKNHRNLLDEAESSFTNKMAVSRGNAKVKTTQELIESLQNRSNASISPAKNMEDWNERAAKLTERVSLIDKKLNASANRIKKKKPNRTVLESGSVTNIKHENVQSESPTEDEIVIVDDDRDSPVKQETLTPDEEPVGTTFVPSLSIEEALSRLPPIDHAHVRELYDDNPCNCVLNECSGEDAEERFTFTESPDCPANTHLEHNYRLKDISGERIKELHTKCVEHVNGNFGNDSDVAKPEESDEVVNIVPNFYELSPKQVDRDSVCENYKKYSISDCDETNIKFREYHEVLDRPSYNGDVLRILPYVVID